MGFDSTKTEVAIVFTLLPLSFESSFIILTSLGHIGQPDAQSYEA